MKGQRPQERWIGAHWESQEANPLPSYRLSASVCITGYRRSDCRRGRRESIRVRSGPNPDSIIGEANVQNPSLQPNTPPRLPAKTAFKFNILNPSRLKREARAGDYVTFPEILQRSSKANESANVTQTVLSRGWKRMRLREIRIRGTFSVTRNLPAIFGTKCLEVRQEVLYFSILSYN